MMTIKGKYNFANIMIDTVDDATIKQVYSFLNHPAFADSYIAIMPDCHSGKGAVIGFTMKENDYVIPNVIGTDLSCGMLMAKFPLQDINRSKLDAFIHEKIPAGFSKNSTPCKIMNYLEYTINEVCKKIGYDTSKALNSIGTLGGGNHFIEMGKTADSLVFTIHTGSRGFGNAIATFYQDKAKELLKKYFVGDSYKDLEFLHKDSREAQDYMYATLVAGEYAEANREEIMWRLSDFVGMEPTTVIESVHNFIGRDGILRKGATSAKLGEDVIIPFNMRDGIALCKGKGSSKYNFSAPHGAGRILSRSKAKANLDVEFFQEQMRAAGVYTTTADKNTLDESPDAYKDMQLILDNITETVEVVELIKPIYNFKAGGE